MWAKFLPFWQCCLSNVRGLFLKEIAVSTVVVPLLKCRKLKIGIFKYIAKADVESYTKMPFSKKFSRESFGEEIIYKTIFLDDKSKIY